MSATVRNSSLYRILRWLLRGVFVLTTIVLLVVAVLFIRAGFIDTEALYADPQPSEEARQQFDRLAYMVNRSVEKRRLDIYTGYTEICGEGVEWNYGFYIFYALCLEKLVQLDPGQLEHAQEQIELCTRLMLHLPVDASNETISRELGQLDEEYPGSLVTGYQCLVLGVRRQLVEDTIYDSIMRSMAEALEREIRTQLERCSGVYTSDQSTQLHAIWRVDQALGTDRSELYELWLTTMQSKFIDSKTGLLHSMVSIDPDRIVAPARSTSVAWSIIFLEDLFPAFVKKQYQALRADRFRKVFSMAAVQEFPELNILSLGDMDSGPMLLGISPSATGFTLYGHKVYGTKMDYTRTYRTLEMFGLPTVDATGKYYRMANGMGDAILLYSKIAQPIESAPLK